MTGDRFEAENIAQDTFIKVFNSLSKYRFKGFKTWISRIAANSCIDYKRRMAKLHEDTVPPDELTEFKDGFAPTVEDLVIVKEEISTVRSMCDSLPDIYKEVVIQYYIRSKSVRQIAQEEGLNEKTVETRLYRALKILGQKWKEGYG
jgi:RNA polymerase sigma factor (sigma-70 family)